MTNYAEINPCDLANGSGVRVSIFFSGCTLHCPGCFNKNAQDFNYGKPFTDQTIDEILELLEPNYIQGLSILGGEPFDNIEALSKLVFTVKHKYPNKDVWIWTGYNRDELPKTDEAEFIYYYSDYLITGRYEKDKRDVSLKFRGSSNQRILHNTDKGWRDVTDEA